MHHGSIARCVVAALALAALVVGGCTPRSYETRERPGEADVVIYTVVEGDTLSRIADRYRMDVQTIIDANRLRDVELYVGQRLRLPGARERPVYRPKPTPEPAAGTAQPAKPDTSWYRPRSAWSRQGIDLSNIDRMGAVTRITVHHTADDGDLGADPVDALRRIEAQHKAGLGKNKPFACIGYHFLISADGAVWEGRPVEYQGAHAEGDNNIGNVGVCLLGNFDRGKPTPAQVESMRRLLDRLCATYRVPRTEIYGHRHFKTTDCPGRFLEPLVDAYVAGR